MKTEISISVLIENTVQRRGLKAEHGLSFWISTPDGTIMFDTGQSPVLIENARTMGINLNCLTGVAISHGHYDHTGGLIGILNESADATVYAHPGIFVNRYSHNPKREKPVEPIHIPFKKEEMESRCKSLVLGTRPTQLADQIYLTGEIPRENDFEDTGGDFYIDDACTIRDMIPDDQALFMYTVNGLVIVLGCCHAGIINTLNFISSLTGEKKIHGVLGGMHLLKSSGVRIEKTMDCLKQFDVQILGPCHCTGGNATQLFQKAFPGKIADLSTGSRITFV